MTVNEQRNIIIEKLYLNKSLNETLVKYFPKDLGKRNEFKSHLFNEIFKIKPEKLIDLDQQNKTEFFCIKIIQFQIKSNTSSWYREQKKHRIHQGDGIELTYNNPEYSVDNEFMSNEYITQIENDNMANNIFKVINETIEENPHLKLNVRLFISRYFYGLTHRIIAKNFNLKFTTSYLKIMEVEKIIAEKLGITEIKRYKKNKQKKI